MIGKSIGDLHWPVYYIAGLRAGVSGLRAMLNDADTNHDGIRVEESAGY